MGVELQVEVAQPLNDRQGISQLAEQSYQDPETYQVSCALSPWRQPAAAQGKHSALTTPASAPKAFCGSVPASTKGQQHTHTWCGMQAVPSPLLHGQRRW